jgi:WD40-like Beta Propeller Repeat
MTRFATRQAVALTALCLVGPGCHPPDANLGGAWSCPVQAAASCFYFDSALQPQTSDGGPQQHVTNDAVRASFDVAEDPDPANAPRIAYPLDQTTEPSNIYDLDIQWHRLRIEQTLFRIRVESPNLPFGRYDIYTQCLPSHDGCHYSVPDSEPNLEWRDNVLAPLAGSEASLTVAGSDGKGGLISVSTPIHLRFSYAPVKAGLYYWSARPPNAPPGSPDEGTTYRLALGSRSAAPFIRPGKENPDQCEGCHAVSGDGRVIAFTATDDLTGPGAGTFIAKNTTDPSDTQYRSSDDPGSAMIAVDYRGEHALIGVNDRLFFRTLADGTQVEIPSDHLGVEGHAYFPDFSPDGQHIVVTLSDHRDKPWAVSTGSIATLDFDGTPFSAAKILVPMTEQEFHFYPSWSPDSQWIVFASAPRGLDPSRCCFTLSPACKAPSDPSDPACQIISYDQANARLRLVHFPDGRVYDLNRATQGVGLTSTLPKFAPLPVNGHNQLFITFNSKMPYGIEVPDKIPAQLWLSVLDFDRLPDDPSSAPVWLPFQNFGQKNHMAYWTDNIPCRTDVDSSPECGLDESCQKSTQDQTGTCTPNTSPK